MFKKLIKNVFLVFTVLSSIGGSIAFYLLVTEGDEYGLTFYLINSQNIIEANEKVPDLRLFFNGVELKSLYLSNVQLKNTGERALTKEDIFQPVTMEVGNSNRIFKATSVDGLTSYENNLVSFNWELLNPGQSINAQIFSETALDIVLTQEIKEITHITYLNQLINPSIEKRINSISSSWLLLLIFSILFAIDSMLLVKEDVKLQRVFNHSRTLINAESVGKKEYLDRLLNLYEDYYGSVPILFIKPKWLINAVSSKLSAEKRITGRFLEIARQETINNVRFANLYSIRSIGIFVGPLLFGFCVIKISWALIV